jgi:D-glycero-D-manno-heptose 1,7-bisphosphate phosphatase
VTTRLVILDRDGVINEDSPEYIKSEGEWLPIPGSLEAIARLNHQGFKVVVATNQSGLARGLFSLEKLNAIHQKMRRELDRVGGQLDGIFFCPHIPEDQCRCRKPQPGLLLEIRDRLGVDLRQVPMIGDSYRDLQTAWAVGGRGILVETGKGLETRARHHAELTETPIFANLAAAVQDILGTHSIKAHS